MATPVAHLWDCLVPMELPEATDPDDPVPIPLVFLPPDDAWDLIAMLDEEITSCGPSVPRQPPLPRRVVRKPLAVIAG